MSICDDGSLLVRAQRDAQARAAASRAMPSPRWGWRGTMTVSSPGKALAQPAVRRRSGSPPRPDGSRRRRSAAGRASARRSASSFASSAGGAGTSSLRLPVHHDARRAERAEALGVARRLRQAQVETAEQRRDRRARDAASARTSARDIRPLIEDHRDAPRRRRHDQVRPQVGFDEQRQRRPPDGRGSARRSAANRRG